MSHDLSLKEIKEEYHGTLKSYLIGFTASLLLTAISFTLVYTKVFSAQVTAYVIIGLALTQAIFQLLFFLHVGQEAKPRWESLALSFTVIILLAVVVGSLWVMNDLNMRMMPNM
jgi:cytochrome o ubiquinol oxidase subunit IV